MKHIKEFLCDKTFPTKEEIEECIEMANTEDYFIKLKWWNHGWHEMIIKKGMTFKDCNIQLPYDCQFVI